MKSWALAVGAGAIVSGCSFEDRSIEPPAGVDWVAVLRYQDGRLAEPGSLHRVEAARGLRLGAPRSSDLRLLGYGDAEIQALSPPDRESIAASPIFEQTRCEEPLPVPRWSVSADVDEWVVRSSSSAPKLTATWIPSSCPPLDLVFDTICGGPMFCPAVLLGSGCSVTAQIDCDAARGELILARNREGLCGVFSDDCSFDAGGEALSCRRETCTTRVRPMPPPLPASVARVHVGGPPLAPDNIAKYNLTLDRIGDAGTVRDLAVVGDEIAVATGAFESRRVCLSGEPTRVTFIDADRLSTRTTTAPPCLVQLEPDPAGPGFLGVFGLAGGVAIGRFDRTGRLVQGEQLRQAPASTAVVISGLIANRSGVWTAWDENPDFGTTLGHTRLVRIDLATLKVTSGSTIAWTNPLTGQPSWARTVAMTYLEERAHVALLTQKLPTIFFFDATSLMEVSRGSAHVIRNPPTTLGTVPAFAMKPLPDDSVLVSASDPPALIVVDRRCEEMGRCSNPAVAGSLRAIWPERDAQPIGFASWPPEPEITAVVGAAYEGDELRAIIGRYDPAAGAFLPGTLELGFGIARDVVTDAAGRLWVSLPWAGEVVRVTPR